MAPGAKVLGNVCRVVTQHEDARLGQADGICGLEDVRQQFGLYNGNGGFCRPEVVLQLMRSVGWVCAGEEPTKASDAIYKDGIFDAIEGGYADAVTWFQSELREAGYELADCRFDLVPCIVVGRVECIDVYLQFVSKWSRVECHENFTFLLRS